MGARQTTQANAEGCYEFKSLPSNVYRVTVRLEGFNNETRDKVTVPAGIVRVDFQIRPSRICECLAPPRTTTLLELWERAAAVVHVRITDNDGQVPVEGEYFLNTATVLEVLRRHPDGGPVNAVMTFMQSQFGREPEPYYAGEEFVIFMPAWSSTQRVFYLGGCCLESRSSVLPIEVGLVVRSPIPGVAGMRLDDLLTELRALPTGK